MFFRSWNKSLIYPVASDKRWAWKILFFYVEADADQNNEDFKKAVRCLETYADVKLLGSY